MSCGSATCPRSAFATIVQPAAGGMPFPLGWLPVLRQMHDRWRQRQALLDLDDRLLEDIGITREEAERAARKPLWK